MNHLITGKLMISTLNGGQFTRLVARRYNAIASLPLRGKWPVYARCSWERIKRERGRERERKRKDARENAAEERRRRARGRAR